MGIVFIGGVHGVGKTSSCVTVSQVMSLPHFTASNLIKSLDSNAVKTHTKSVASVSKNQDLLVEAAKQILSKSGPRFILDGHFLVPNMLGKFEPVPVDVFRLLELEGIVFCFDDPIRIYNRRMQRDNKSLSVSEIESIQGLEQRHAEHVALSLDLTLFKVNALDIRTLSSAISRILNIKLE